MSYSCDMRERALELLSEGKKKTEVARILGVHRQSVQNWARQAEAGRLSAGTPGPKQNSKVPEDELREAIEARPDARLSELAHQLGVHTSTISKALKRLGIRRKKNVALQRVSAL